MNKNISLYKKTEEILEKLKKSSSSIGIYNLTYTSFLIQISEIGSIIDASSNYCDECMKFKKILLEYLKDFQNILVFPIFYIKNRNNINKTMEKFIDHFKNSHENINEILKNDYGLWDYYIYKYVYTKNRNSDVFSVINRYDLDIFEYYFSWLDNAFSLNEGKNLDVKEKYIIFLNNFFYICILSDAKNEYAGAMENIVKTFNEVRANFIKGLDKDWNYQIIYDLNLCIEANENLLKVKPYGFLEHLESKEKYEKNKSNANYIKLFFLMKEDELSNLENVEEEYVELAKKLDELNKLFNSNPSDAFSVFFDKYSDEIMLEIEKPKSEEEIKNDKYELIIFSTFLPYMGFSYLFIKLTYSKFGHILLLLLIFQLIILLIIKKFKKDVSIKPYILIMIMELLYLIPTIKNYEREIPLSEFAEMLSKY